MAFIHPAAFVLPQFSSFDYTLAEWFNRFILSYLLTRNRLPEFAVMRSLGAKKIQVYLAFLPGAIIPFTDRILPIAITSLLKPEWLPIVQNNLLQF